VGSVSSTEGIVDINFAQLRQLLGKSFIVLFFALVEAQVFKEQNFARLQLSGSLLSNFTNAIVSELDRLTEQFAQPLRYRSERILLIALTLWATEVGHEDEFCSSLSQVADCRDGGS
jgi:hypothetical protein